ncbi:MAG TPA: tetratricopeptide repeat protein [Bacteriovoracaceae bacterium]|nr:tetratricopeptide repeat protein [Bacteriovoracaceae bacterium]
MTNFLTLLILMTFSTACIKTAEQLQREKRIENMSEQMKDSQGLVADVLAQLKDMQNQLDKMNGKIEEIEHRQGKVNPENLSKMSETMNLVKTQQESQSAQMLQFQAELKEQRGFLEKVTTSLAASSREPEPKAKKKSAKADLADAIGLVKSNKYDEARSELSSLMNNSENSPGDQNKILFNLGKVEFFTKNYEKALTYFSKIYTKYPKASLAPTSLLFIGRTLEKMGKKDEAKEAFGQVVESYPESKDAVEAKKEL